MNKTKRLFGFLTAAMVILLSCTTQRKSRVSIVTSKSDVLAIINKVNGYWQTNHPPQQRAFWDVAAYHTGNMEAYAITKNETFKKYSEAWAEHNQWKGAKSDIKANWKYSYGEKDDYVLFGDWQICFQTYIDLYNLEGQKDAKKIARAREVMEYQMGTPKNDYWWWADGLYMVMPVMVKLHQVTGNPLYLQKLHEYFSFANSIMYDGDEKLYYRDAKYVYPKHKSANGKKDFWARGDGWVFAGLAKVLKDLPKTDVHREEYIAKYKGMAEAIKASQQPGGYWTRSMLDSAHAPGPETSGTAFFTYGMLWGINNGYLDQKKYLPVVEKAWAYLTKVALQPDGKVGYIQPIGERAIPGQVVDKNATSNFGVGAFLMAACEMYRYLDKVSGNQVAVTSEDKSPRDNASFRPGEQWYDDKGEVINAHGGGLLYHNKTYYWFGEKRGRSASEGVSVYSSKDLYNWKNEGLAFVPSQDTTSDVTRGCIMERPKVIYNEKTRRFVMWFHLELKGQGYRAARAAVAVSDKVTGPYRFVSSFRPNGNMSRDMGLFVDDDGSAYHIYSSRENYDLRLSKLSDDYLTPTTEDKLLFSNHREAPALMKWNNKYYLVTSGCTGWKPNRASIHVASSLWGPWELIGDPMVGPGADTTFGGQSTFIQPIAGKKDAYIFMADHWNPRNLKDSRYIWLPVRFKNDQPYIEWINEWSLKDFSKSNKNF